MKKKKNTWKIIGLIFIILFGILLLFNLWGSWSIRVEEQKTNECYYDICEGYPDALYGDNICSCYDYDMMGELVIAKEKYMKD